MKNRFLFVFFFLIFNSSIKAENIIIEAKNITLNKNQKSSLFENEVKVETKEGYTIKSDTAEYNKETGILILKKNIIGNDEKNNIVKADFAKYDENTKIFLTTGPTSIITSENYTINGKDINFDNDKGFGIRTVRKDEIKFYHNSEVNEDTLKMIFEKFFRT